MTPALILRPPDRAEGTAARVAALGFTPVVAPPLVQRNLSPVLELEGVQALIATSGAGARGLARCGAPDILPVYCVGLATARAARVAGFQHAVAAGGTVDTLRRCLLHALVPEGGALLFGRAQDVTGDLGGGLVRRGFDFREAVVYTMDPALSLPRRALAVLTGSSVALAYSTRGAQAFCKLVPRSSRARCTVISISINAAAPLYDKGFQSILIASQPTEDAMLDQLALISGHPTKGL